jgi:hypothetical protein
MCEKWINLSLRVKDEQKNSTKQKKVTFQKKQEQKAVSTIFKNLEGINH